MLLILWIISTSLAYYWTKRCARRAFDKGATEYGRLWPRVLLGVIFRLTLFFWIPGLFMSFGAQSERGHQNAIAMLLIAWFIALIPLLFVIPIGTKKVFKEKQAGLPAK